MLNLTQPAGHTQLLFHHPDISCIPLLDPASPASFIEPLLTASSLSYLHHLTSPSSSSFLLTPALALQEKTTASKRIIISLATNKNTKNPTGLQAPKQASKMRSSALLAALGAAGLAAAQTTITSDTVVPVSTIVVSSPTSVASSKSFSFARRPPSLTHSLTHCLSHPFPPIRPLPPTQFITHTPLAIFFSFIMISQQDISQLFLLFLSQHLHLHLLHLLLLPTSLSSLV